MLVGTYLLTIELYLLIHRYVFHSTVLKILHRASFIIQYYSSFAQELCVLFVQNPVVAVVVGSLSSKLVCYCNHASQKMKKKGLEIMHSVQVPGLKWESRRKISSIWRKYTNDVAPSQESRQTNTSGLYFWFNSFENDKIFLRLKKIQLLVC